MLNEQLLRQSEQRIRQIDARTKQIENETEQLRQENARGRQLLASIDALCFPPECSSTHPNPTEPDSRPSSL
jgi:cell shape-determining protein MreC